MSGDARRSLARRQPFQNLILLIVSTTISLLLAESIVRRFVRVGSYRYESRDGLPFQAEDATRQYALMPGYRGKLVAPEFNNVVEINSLGFRGPEERIEAPWAHRYVFVVGDSFVFGVGVDQQSSIPGRLQEYLAERYDACPRVWNLGVPGYATQQYVYAVERYLELAVPEVVVFAVYAGRLPSGANDLSGSVEFDTWETELKARPQPDGGPRTLPSGEAARSRGGPRLSSPGLLGRLKNWLSWHSALYNLILLRAGPEIRALTHRARTIDAENPQLLRQGWEILDRQLLRLRRLSHQHRFEVILVYIPEQSDLINNHRLLSDRLRVLAARHRYAYVDGFDVVPPSSAREAYYPLDGHLNSLGYSLFAREIARHFALDCPRPE